jgi:hypothetical protein
VVRVDGTHSVPDIEAHGTVRRYEPTYSGRFDDADLWQELAFDAPWQSTVFGLAAAVIDHAFGGDREPFRRQLIEAIAAEPGRPYWESWTTALEALVESLPERPAP